MFDSKESPFRLDSPKLSAVRDWIIVLLVERFRREPGQELEVTGAQIEINWTQWINEKADLTPRPSNVSRRFRELREEWRTDQKSPGENLSRLSREAGIVQIDRLQFTPLKLGLVQGVFFEPEDCPLIKADGETAIT